MLHADSYFSQRFMSIILYKYDPVPFFTWIDPALSSLKHPLFIIECLACESSPVKRFLAAPPLSPLLLPLSWARVFVVSSHRVIIYPPLEETKSGAFHPWHSFLNQCLTHN